jgi:hypothetical protein
MRNRVILAMILFLVFIIPTKVIALTPQILINYHSYGEETETNTIVDDEKEEETKFSILGAMKYRLFEKDTRDGWDYLLLATFAVGILIVLVYKNTHYYIVKIPKEKDVVEIADNDIELVDKIEPKEKVAKKSTAKKRTYKKKDT